MAIKRINIDEFIRLGSKHLLLDVRSPGEYVHARIPWAVSLPLFTDEERKIVGTAYKQEGREVAIKVGLDFFKMRPLVEEVEKLLNNRTEKKVLVHCWRGGMRSGAVAWLLDLYGFDVTVLEGGYKSFRNWVLSQLEKNYSLQILGGLTGSGKTEILQEIERLGHPVVDLEDLAGHKGSVFGHLGLPVQGSNEQFENKLALALFDCVNRYGNESIWLESESSRIGVLAIYHKFFTQMAMAPRLRLDIPFEARLAHIMEGYGHFSPQELISSTLKIKKRLGGLETQTIVNFFEENRIEEAFDLLLKYYDRVYKRADEEQQVENLYLEGTNAVANAKVILEKWQKK